MIVIINLHAVFFHGIFLRIAENFSGKLAFDHCSVGSSAYADCLCAENVLEFNRFFKIEFCEVFKTDMAAYADKTELIKLCLDFFCISSEVACKFNAVIADFLDFLKSFEKGFFVFDMFSDGINLNSIFHSFFLLICHTSDLIN